MDSIGAGLSIFGICGTLTAAIIRFVPQRGSINGRDLADRLTRVEERLAALQSLVQDLREEVKQVRLKT